MSMTQPATRHPRSVAPPTIREHRIPTAGQQALYRGRRPRRRLWFCESGASKIGRFDPKPTPSRNSNCRRRTPRRSASSKGRTARSGSPRRPATRSAASRRTARSPNSRCRRRTPGRTRMMVGPDGNIWFSRDRGEPDRPHHAGRQRSPNSRTASRPAASRSRSSCATA